jgi:beta-N-acetylhexosaminidase
LSPTLLTQLLRGELGYTGAVVTDCLEMEGIAKHFGVEEAALAAVEAGADLLLACHTLETQRRIHGALLDAAREGRLPVERIDASVERILKLKDRYGLRDRRAAAPGPTEEVVGAPRFIRLERELSERAVTIVSDTGESLPLGAGGVQVSGAPHVAAALAAALCGLGIDAEAPAESGGGSGETGILVILPGDPAPERRQAMVRKWQEQGRRVIVVAAREPYPLAGFWHAPCLIATFGHGEAVINALARVLAGQAKPEGRLPVSVVRKPLSGYNDLE